MKHRLCSIIMMALISIVATTSMEAQFLKKIAKGLEKAQKTLEKIEKGAVKNPSKSDKPAHEHQSNQGNGTEENNNGVSETMNEDGEENEDGIKIPANVGLPYFTEATMFIEAPEYTLSPVYEDIFYVKRSMDLYEFWKTDGTKLTDPVWEKCTVIMGVLEPEFNSGVVAMVRPNPIKYKPGTVCLIYSDGRVKELDKSIRGVTNFRDGVAIATNDKDQYFYIDTSGKRIYPDITVYPAMDPIIRPLKDGLRAYPKKFYEWGYLDASGNVKLAPKFKEASDFSEGYAWVVMDDDTKHLIDKTGKSVFKAPTKNVETSPVNDGRFFVRHEGTTCYYDIQGNKLKCFISGTHFYGGYAFIGTKYDTHCYVIDKDMSPLNDEALTIVPQREIWENGPYFNKHGLASVKEAIIYPDGEIKVNSLKSTASGYYDFIYAFGRLTDSGYVTAEMLSQDNRAKVLMNSDGKIVMVVSEEPYFAQPIPSHYVIYMENGKRVTSGSFSFKKLDINQKPLTSK